MHEYMRARIQDNNIYLKRESKRYEEIKDFNYILFSELFECLVPVVPFKEPM